MFCHASSVASLIQDHRRGAESASSMRRNSRRKGANNTFSAGRADGANTEDDQLSLPREGAKRLSHIRRQIAMQEMSAIVGKELLVGVSINNIVHIIQRSGLIYTNNIVS